MHTPRLPLYQRVVAAICFGCWLALTVYVLDGTMIQQPHHHTGVYVCLSIGAFNFGLASWIASKEWD